MEEENERIAAKVKRLEEERHPFICTKCAENFACFYGLEEHWKKCDRMIDYVFKKYGITDQNQKQDQKMINFVFKTMGITDRN